jgi:large subunit ribosomal protein L19
MANRAFHDKTEFHVGDTIQVHYKIIEKETKAGKTKKGTVVEVKERIQPFEGVVIAINGIAENKSLTVRRLGANNNGMERVFPLVSPWIKKITVKRRGSVRRSKLYYLRETNQLDAIKKLS